MERDYRQCKPRIFQAPDLSEAPLFTNGMETVRAVEMPADFQFTCPPRESRPETKREMAHRLAAESRHFSVSFHKDAEGKDEPDDEHVSFHKKQHVKLRPDELDERLAKFKADLAGKRNRIVTGDGGQLRGFGKDSIRNTRGHFVCRSEADGSLFVLDFDEFEKAYKPA